MSVTDIFRNAVRNVNNELVINNKYLNKFTETVAYRRNQTCFSVNLRITVNQDQENYLGACLAADMTSKNAVMHELRQTKNELELSRQLKNEFVANISHELRTPVNGIKGLVENLMETELTPKQLETVNIIDRCCTNMNVIINDLLDYTKIVNNKLVLEQREFFFRSFIKNIIDFNINKISEKGLKLLINVEDDIPLKVIGDELRLTQILNNLFSNAIKFTSVGHIALEVVKTEQTEHEVELFFMVMDTGIGISLEEKDKLFQSFSQVDGSITRRFGGTGLGLSICKLLVEAMQGTITVESEKNKGSNFSFSIRMGIPQSQELPVVRRSIGKIMQNFEIINRNSIGPAPEQSFTSDYDFIGRLLENANPSILIHDSDTGMGSQSQYDKEKMTKEILDLLDRLMICIEMESWVKAEEFATAIRRQIPEDNKELKNKTLRIVLSVRKEEHDNSLNLLNEIREMINEVTVWKI
jgi:signal transduction histidine kinase